MREQKSKIKYAKKMCLAALLLTAAFLPGGCTRKESLLLLEEELVLEEQPGESGNSGTPGADGESGNAEEPLPEMEKKGPIYVHVCGAVERPGVYELKEGSRVYEAVQAAGGFAACAEQNFVNQAQVLTDGVKLVIPTVEEAAAAREREPLTEAQTEGGAETAIGIVAGEPSDGTKSEDPANAGDGRININTASQDKLCEIPGIGATRAAAIAAYRDSHGGFKKPEDIMQVSGIKEGMYEKIKDSICVN